MIRVVNVPVSIFSGLVRPFQESMDAAAHDDFFDVFHV